MFLEGDIKGNCSIDFTLLENNLFTDIISLEILRNFIRILRNTNIKNFFLQFKNFNGSLKFTPVLEISAKNNIYIYIGL